MEGKLWSGRIKKVINILYKQNFILLGSNILINYENCLYKMHHEVENFLQSRRVSKYPTLFLGRITHFMSSEKVKI